MYKVRLIKHVHSCFASASSGDVYVEREVELPFPPYHGLTICDGDFSVVIHQRDDEKKIDGCEIYWKVKEKRFDVYVEPDKELYWSGLNSGSILTGKKDKKLLKEIVQELVEEGWVERE
jgi:hypothetical protein